MRQRHSGAAPLEGVRVVDFGHWVAGPYATQVLSQLGATVVKVEPLTGDAMSHSLPAAYAVANRGKQSLAIDLKAPGARDVLSRLIAWSDVVAHNYRPGVAERLGFGREQIREIDPSVIVLESTAYGLDGPSVARPGFDPIFWAISGHAFRGGGSSGPPVCNTRLGPIDGGTGMLGAFAALTALYRSRRTGVGGSVAVSLLDTSLFLLSEVVRDASGTFVGAAAVDRERTGPHPAEALYELADGWVAVLAVSEAARRQLAVALGLTAVADRPRHEWTADDQDAIRDRLRPMTRERLDRAFVGADVWVIPCSLDAKNNILTSGSLLDAGIVVRSESDPRSTYVGFPVEFDRSQLTTGKTDVPELGEHTDDVLHLLGFSDHEIAGMHDANVVIRRG